MKKAFPSFELKVFYSVGAVLCMSSLFKKGEAQILNLSGYRG